MDKILYNNIEYEMRKIIAKYESVFALSKKELGKTPIAKHNNRVKSEAIPVKHNPYRCSSKETDFLKKEIDLLLELGYIERCEATWVMPVIMVNKKDITNLRMYN